MRKGIYTHHVTLDSPSSFFVPFLHFALSCIELFPIYITLAFTTTFIHIKKSLLSVLSIVDQKDVHGDNPSFVIHFSRESIGFCHLCPRCCEWRLLALHRAKLLIFKVRHRHRFIYSQWITYTLLPFNPLFFLWMLYPRGRYSRQLVKR